MTPRDLSCQFQHKKALINEKASSMGLWSGKYGGRNISLHSVAQRRSIDAQAESINLLTSFILNKCSDLFSMMNSTVIKNKDTLWPWVWICERYLVSGQI